MNPTREELLFGLALTKPTAERAAFLDRECGGDSALRRRVEALLAAHEQPDTLLATQGETNRPTMKDEFAEVPADEAVGQTLGRYKLLERVGEGGCGVVYVAEQTEPVRRRVALKVIKLGMDTKQVVARFEAERQALAMMDHPNIAKVLDAGATDTGRLYFVMELVRGIRITDYCDQAHLSTKERLGLFIQVCQAIHDWYGVFLPPGIGAQNLKFPDVDPNETKGISVWVDNNEFVFTFDGRNIRTNLAVGQQASGTHPSYQQLEPEKQ